MTYTSRADLMNHPAFEHLEEDSSGLPCVWENHYDPNGQHWSSTWSCQCSEDGIEPYHSEWIGPTDPDLIALWESLPEEPPLDAAQRHQMEQEALTGPEWNIRERNTILAALRFWQRKCDPRDPEMDIATDNDTEALGDDEIDALIERIQT